MSAVLRDVQVLLSEILIINLIPLLISFYLKLNGNILRDLIKNVFA